MDKFDLREFIENRLYEDEDKIDDKLEQLRGSDYFQSKIFGPEEEGFLDQGMDDDEAYDAAVDYMMGKLRKDINIWDKYLDENLNEDEVERDGRWHEFKRAIIKDEDYSSDDLDDPAVQDALNQETDSLFKKFNGNTDVLYREGLDENTDQYWNDVKDEIYDEVINDFGFDEEDMDYHDNRDKVAAETTKRLQKRKTEGLDEHEGEIHFPIEDMGSLNKYYKSNFSQVTGGENEERDLEDIASGEKSSDSEEMAFATEIINMMKAGKFSDKQSTDQSLDILTQEYYG